MGRFTSVVTTGDERWRGECGRMSTGRGRGWVWGSGPTSESPGALSVPRPPPLAVPPSVPGARAPFSGARARAVSAGGQQWGLHLLGFLLTDTDTDTPYLFLRRPYSSLRSSLEMGFRCMKLQKPPLVHSLWNGNQRLN